MNADEFEGKAADSLKDESLRCSCSSLSLKRHRDVADITNRCLMAPAFEGNFMA